MPGLTEGEIEPEGDPEGREALPGVWETLAESEEDLAACLAALDELGASYETAAPLTAPDDPDCGIANPVVLSAPAPGVELSPPATLRCETARALSEWTQRFVVPAAEALGRGALTGIDQAGDYQCRRRNNAPDGALSEHSFGNAVDVVGFRFAGGDPIAVEPREDEGTLAEAFQRSARATSCLGFATVLGPGTDAGPRRSPPHGRQGAPWRVQALPVGAAPGAGRRSAAPSPVNLPLAPRVCTGGAQGVHRCHPPDPAPLRGTCPSPPRCRPCGWRSPTRCRTRTAPGTSSPPKPWSDRWRTPTSAGRG